MTTGGAGEGRGFGMLFTFGLGRPGPGKRKAGSRKTRWCALRAGAAATGTVARMIAVQIETATMRPKLQQAELDMGHLLSGAPLR